MRCGSPKRAPSSACLQLRPAQAVVDRFPQSQALGISGGVGLERDDVRRPTCRHRNPVAFLKEERLSQDAAADLEIAPIARVGPAITGDARTHLLGRPGAVGLPECRPGERTRQRVGIGEYASADDHVAGRMKLEQKHFARLKRPEIRRRRRPEIDLIEVRLPAQHFEPIVICYCNDRLMPISSPDTQADSA